ncbi:hypothetical protein [Staphylococcus aureus]|nr:hypothetical protein [Staphylococcus aureus]
MLKRGCEVYNINMDKPFKQLTDLKLEYILDGAGAKEFESVLRRRE